MRDWRESSVADLAEIVSGGTPSRDVSSFWNGGVPWVTPTDITASRTNYLSETADSLSRLGLLSSSAKMLPAGAILFTSRASVGLVKMAAMPVCTNQGFKSLVPHSRVDGPFLFYQVERLRGQFQRYAAGSTFPEINKGDTGRVRIPHPVSRDEQRRIASVLEAVDAAIRSTSDLIGKYQQIKIGLMHDLFTRGVLPNGQLRPHCSGAPELYQETAVGWWIPKEWSVSDCSREFAIDSGITLGPHRRPNRNARPYLRVANVHRDELRLEDLAYLEGLAGDADLPLKERDLLIVEGHANRMEIGRCAMVTAAAVGMLFQNHLFRLRPQRLVPEFALDWLNSHHAQRYWDMTCSTSSGLNTINRKMLGRLPVLVPPVDEQARIVSAVAVAKCRIAEEARLFEKLVKQKLGLMQDLLTGRISVAPLAPESASA
jgi:type I restriction enzyme S subunit